MLAGIHDRVTVTDPELIKRITVHADVDRIHGVPTKDKPWCVRHTSDVVFVGVCMISALALACVGWPVVDVGM